MNQKNIRRVRKLPIRLKLMKLINHYKSSEKKEKQSDKSENTPETNSDKFENMKIRKKEYNLKSIRKIYTKNNRQFENKQLTENANQKANSETYEQSENTFKKGSEDKCLKIAFRTYKTKHARTVEQLRKTTEKKRHTLRKQQVRQL